MDCSSPFFCFRRPPLRSLREARKKPPRIEVSSPCDKFPRNSISPARVLIENVPNGKDTHTLEFQTLWNDNSRQRYSFSVPPGQTRQAVIYPSMTDSQLLYRNSADESISLFAASEDAPFFAVLQEKTPSEWNMLSDSPFNAQVNTFDLMDWPADYRMYAAQNCIIVPEKLYESYLDEPHRKALRQWVLGGGSLWLIGDRGRNITAVPLGRGLILHVPSLEGLTDKEKEAALLKLKTETKDIFPVKVDGYYQTRLHPKVPDASPYFFTTPSFLLGLILVAFAVLVGPVCLLRWAPVGKRQRLFILIPAISLGVSILLAAVILIGDGTGGARQPCRAHPGQSAGPYGTDHPEPGLPNPYSDEQRIHAPGRRPPPGLPAGRGKIPNLP